MLAIEVPFLPPTTVCKVGIYCMQVDLLLLLGNTSLIVGLLVGNPLTDSALGRSTATASVTTAGVTQFSDVSLLADWPLLWYVSIPFPG